MKLKQKCQAAYILLQNIKSNLGVLNWIYAFVKLTNLIISLGIIFKRILKSNDETQKEVVLFQQSAKAELKWKFNVSNWKHRVPEFLGRENTIPSLASRDHHKYTYSSYIINNEASLGISI